MKTFAAVFAFLVAIGFAAPALAQLGVIDSGGTPHDPGGYDTQPQSTHKKAGADPEGAAEELRARGECDRAIPILRSLVSEGAGYEIAQLTLGLCLFDLAKADAAQAAAFNKEGASWVLRAANAGFGKAQAEAVVIYLDGTGVAVDPVEAKKWALIYHSNGMRLAIGLPDIAADERKRLDTMLTGAKRAEARTRVDSWTQTAQNPDQ